MKKAVIAFALFTSGLTLGVYFRGGYSTAVAGGTSPRGLPATGQTKCYDPSGKEAPCDGAVCPGQDGHYKAGCPSAGRFVDNKDGTVTDNCTGLMWQKDTADVNGDGKIDGADQLPWCKALSYCENLKLSAHDDWRLPNVRELQSIVDYGRFVPASDPVFGALSWWYWSSTSSAAGGADGPVDAWMVSFNHGGVAVVRKDGSSVLHVRAVRTAP